MSHSRQQRASLRQASARVSPFRPALERGGAPSPPGDDRDVPRTSRDCNLPCGSDSPGCSRASTEPDLVGREKSPSFFLSNINNLHRAFRAGPSNWLRARNGRPNCSRNASNTLRKLVASGSSEAFVTSPLAIPFPKNSNNFRALRGRRGCPAQTLE